MESEEKTAQRAGPTGSGGSPAAVSSGELLEQLRHNVERLEGARRRAAAAGADRISSGCGALDRLLPAGGFPPGSLVEWLGPPGGGAGTLALLAGRAAAGPQRVLAVLDRPPRFYPPAALAWGFAPHQLLVVRPANQRDALWALDQVLRCRGVAAVWAPLERLDARNFRRLQLAAEQSGCLGLLLRSPRVRGAPSWAEFQLLVTPQPRPGGPRRWRVELLRGRGTAAGAAVELEMDVQTGVVREVNDHEPHRLPGVSSLAHPAAGRREARA